MKKLKGQSLFAILLVALCGCIAASAQITPSGDAYTNTATPTTNLGTKPFLDVESASQTSYIQFDLSSIPSGYTSASIAKATLRLYVNAVTTAGSFNVDFINGTWSEKTITADLVPALGTTIVSSVPLTSANVHDYVLIDVTPAVGAWLDGTEPNDGIALVANSPLNASFDSKENTANSQPAELDIVFAGGGTITGVTTASGSGLTGGGTSGTLNLALTKSCAASQVLQWNGSSWVCAAAGTGTITGVTPGPGLLGGGTSGNVTLNLDTTKVPQLNVANTFTGNQTVNGNLSAAGMVTGSGFQIGSNLFAYGSFANSNAFQGFAGNITTTGQHNTATGLSALVADTNGSFNTAAGVQALAANTIGSQNTADGELSLTGNTTGIANAAVGYGALGTNSTGQGNTAVGYFAGIPTDSGALTGVADTFLGTLTALGSDGLNNATAVGYRAEVAQSNSLVLGSINGVNGCSSSSTCADTNVGIGTTAPQTLFHIDHAPQPGVGTDVAEITSGGSIDVASLLLKNTGSGGLRLRVGAGTGSGYLASSGPMVFITADTGSPSFPGSAAMTIDNSGNVHITGNLSKAGGSFKIDHPLDPANKYLYHSFVESPDMMNVYNGNVVTNQRGLATVVLPDYFEVLNRDFRYQLTVIGQFAQAIVGKEISRNRFTIKTNKPSVKVSWQVTGIRHDAYADAHRIQVEEEKSPQEQGRYLHPELFGASPEQAIGMRLAAPAAKADALSAPLSRLAPDKE
jgi:hypothetical protein